MTTTHRITFAVKDACDDMPPRLVLESCGGDIAFMKGGIVWLQLRPGQTDDDARRLARHLNDAIAHLSFSK